MEATTISNDELLEMIKDGHFFNFCAGMAINMGYRDVMKNNVEVKFSVGGYDVRLDKEKACFVLSHREYVFRMITAYFNEVIFIGDSKEEIISELLTEATKELSEPTKSRQQ